MEGLLVLDYSIQQLNNIWRDRANHSSLLIFFIILNSTFTPAVLWLNNTLSSLKYLNTPEQSIFIDITTTLVIIITNVILIIFWIYWRSLPKFQPNEIGILFAPHYDSECADLVQLIFKRFIYELEDRLPENNIRPVFLPQNHKVKNDKEAIYLLEKTEARLVVFGIFERGNIKGEKISGFKKVSFIVKHRELIEGEEKPVMEDIATALAFRDFIIRESDNFIEKDIVVNNLTEVALFFVALGLTLDSCIDTSIEILEELLLSVEKKYKKPCSNQQKYFIKSIKRCYSVALNSKYLEFSRSTIMENVTDHNYDNEFRKGEKLLKKLFDINPQKSEYPLRQAIYDFHFGNIDQAFKNISKAKIMVNGKDASPYFSFAFLCLWKEQYKRAISEYKKAFNAERQSIYVYIDVLYFIQCFQKKHPSRPEFIFALGFMNYNFFDEKQGIQDYKNFIYQAETIPKLSPLVDYAKEQLSLIGEF